jgi:hypothetical protein
VPLLRHDATRAGPAADPALVPLRRAGSGRGD